MQCQAHNRKGDQCKNTAVAGKRVCRFHGGLTPGGPAHPAYKHGRYSKYMPTNLEEKYKAARKDPDLLALSDEIAITDARIMETLEKIDVAGASHNWEVLQEKWQELLKVQRLMNETRGDPVRQAELQRQSANVLRELNEIIDSRAKNIEAWDDVDKLIEQRRRLVQTEGKRLADMKQIITAEKAMALVFALLDIIRRNLNMYKAESKPVDDNLVSLIATDIRAIVTLPDQSEAAE